MSRLCEIETGREASHPLHGRVQVALPERSVVAGRTLSVSPHELCVVLDEQLLIGSRYMIRFELFARGRMHLVTALAKASYGVFASRGGFRVGFQFAEDDSERTALIYSLSGRKSPPSVAPVAAAVAAEAPAATESPGAAVVAS